MNIEILGAMLWQGCSQKNFLYVCEILQISLDENVKPNDRFLKHLHKLYIQCARAIDARVSFIIPQERNFVKFSLILAPLYKK